MKNKKSLLFATIIVVPIVFAICLLSVRTADKREGSVFFSLFGNAELRNTIELPLSEMDQLSIAYSSKNLKVYPTDGDKVIIKEYLISDKEEAKATVTTEADAKDPTISRAVTVTGGSTTVITFFYMGAGERIEIYLPKEGLKSLSLHTSSGNISAEDTLTVKAEELSVSASSGNIKWRGSEAEQITIETSSGNINAEKLTGEMSFHAGSGNMKLQGLTGKISAGTGSGNITIEEFAGEGTLEAGSGNIKVEAKEINGDLSVKTQSGNSKLELPEDLSFSLEVQTGSGNINTNFEDALSYNSKGNQASGSVGENPSCKISVEAGSGNVKIER